MISLITLIGLAVVMFVSTNVDDLFVLLGFFANRDCLPRAVVAGQFLGITALYAASVVFALSALFIPAAWIGLLGLTPIFIGAGKARSLFRGDAEENEDNVRRATGGQVLTVAAVTIANGGDNISTYTPIFATHSPGAVVLIGAVLLLGTGLWCAVSHYMVNHPKLRGPIRKYGHMIVPFALIALGLMILHDAGTVKAVSRFF